MLKAAESYIDVRSLKEDEPELIEGCPVLGTAWGNSLIA